MPLHSARALGLEDATVASAMGCGFDDRDLPARFPRRRLIGLLRLAVERERPMG